MTLPLGVTVTGNHPSRFVDEARTRAREWGLPFVERIEKTSLQRQLEATGQTLLVLSGEGWTLHDALGSLAFTPGMARVRIKRLGSLQQEDDVIVRLCELQPGDTVVDATLGLAGDAQVCAHVVGPTGQVIGLEASVPIALLVREGLRRMKSTIEVRHGAALELLRTMKTGSAACVIFDPMFEQAKKSSPAFTMLRRFALHEPLTHETLDEARRVASRWVVVKSGRYGREFKRLGLTPEHAKKTAPLMWARIPGQNKS